MENVYCGCLISPVIVKKNSHFTFLEIFYNKIKEMKEGDIYDCFGTCR